MPDPGKRLQGRPARGEGDEVGRERLLEATRAILRIRPSREISRKAVADAAGVTPALISYYFPDRRHLLAAATGPLIGERLERLFAILDDRRDRDAALREIVTLIVQTCDTEANLVQVVAEACRVDPSLNRLIASARRRLTAFYLEATRAAAWRDMDPDCVLLALWGMCEAVAGARAQTPETTADPAQDRRIDTIVTLLLHGLTVPARA